MNGRICLVRQSIYPFDLLVRREAETLCQAGLETHLICLEKLEESSPRVRDEVINGVVVHRIPLRRKKSSNARYIYDYASFAVLAGLRLAQLHIKCPFDAVQVNTMPDLLVFSTLLPKLLGVKVISMMYEPTPELWEDLRKSRPPFVLKAVEQMALAYADRSFAVTEQLKDAYVSRGARADKIDVILNVPDPSFLEHAESGDSGQADKDTFVLICHGAIEERYGHDTILEAAALALPQIPNLRVHILGKGTYVSEMLRKRDALGLESRVDYLGYVPLSQMIQELRAADVGIVAQKSSPYSNLVHTGKMYDYISLGKPVLASRLRAVEAYFGPDSLWFFEPGNPQSLADGILDLYLHPEKRASLARNAQGLYAHYRWEEQKKKYLSVYQRLLN